MQEFLDQILVGSQVSSVIPEEAGLRDYHVSALFTTRFCLSPGWEQILRKSPAGKRKDLHDPARKNEKQNFQNEVREKSKDVLLLVKNICKNKKDSAGIGSGSKLLFIALSAGFAWVLSLYQMQSF